LKIPAGKTSSRGDGSISPVPLIHSAMSDEISMRDQHLEQLVTDMQDKLDGLDKSERRELDVNEIEDLITQFGNGLDSFMMELKGLKEEKKTEYKNKLKKHKKTIQGVKNDLEWAKQNATRDELLGERAEPVGPDLASESGVVQHGKNVLDESGQSLQRTLAKVSETRVIAVDTAGKIQEQTNQIEGMYNDLYEIDDTMKRSTAIMKRMFRKVKTEKYLWVLIFLIVAAVLFILIYKAAGGGSDDDGLNTPPPK
jgi:uncharacterized phage infection (PIP) family protein YhgE